MSLFYFDSITAAGLAEDDIGSELPNLSAAKNEAVKAAALWLKDNVSVAGNDLKFSVREGNSEPLFVVTVSLRLDDLAVARNDATFQIDSHASD
jgi:hypothetical protein